MSQMTRKHFLGHATKIATAISLVAVLSNFSAPAQTARPGPLKVCLVSASAEYKSDESLGDFQKYLEATYNAECTRAFGKDKGNDLPGLAALETCDVMVLFTRRVTLPEDQLALVKKYLDAGKPLVGIRTASHAFQNLPGLDKDVLGGSYDGHYTDELAQISIEPKAHGHPILAGVKPFTTMGKLYKNATLAPDARVLLTGTTQSHKEPVAWLRLNKGGRIFYTSMGVPEDFYNQNFRQMLANAVFWTAKREPQKKP